MHYDTLSQSTVKITLTRKDMKDYALKSESIRSRTPESKRSLTGFLRRFQSESSLFPEHSAERLFLEAFPSDDGGCVMYVSTLGCEPLPQTSRSTDTLMCRIAGLEDTVRLCGCLGRSVRESALYLYDRSYYLVVRVSSRDTGHVTRIIGEFGGISDDPTDIACVAEHGRTVCAANAVRVLSALR